MAVLSLHRLLQSQVRAGNAFSHFDIGVLLLIEFLPSILQTIPTHRLVSTFFVTLRNFPQYISLINIDFSAEVLKVYFFAQI